MLINLSQLLGSKGYECDIRINIRVSISDLQSQVPGNATVQENILF